MRTYVADAVALARYLEGDLPKNADRVFQDAEQGIAHIIFPDIVIGELIYTALKGRLKANNPRSLVAEMIDEFGTSAHFEQVTMTPEAWREFLKSSVRELHDRMIHALALSHSADAIVTNDDEIKKTGFATVW